MANTMPIRAVPRKPVSSVSIHFTLAGKLVSAVPRGPEKPIFAIQSPAICGSTVVRYCPGVAVRMTLPMLCITMSGIFISSSRVASPTSAKLLCPSRNSMNKSLPAARNSIALRKQIGRQSIDRNRGERLAGDVADGRPLVGGPVPHQIAPETEHEDNRQRVKNFERRSHLRTGFGI